MINSTTAEEQIQFGLCDPPEPIYLYVGQTEANGETALWYQYDIEAQKQLPVLKRGLTGYISELRITVKEFKGKDNIKLDVVVHADQLYIIRSGIETNFSKTLLLALSCVTDFKQPLTIAVAAGEENVVFARLYDAATKQRFKAEWNPDANWLDLVTRLQQRLGQSPSAQELPLAPAGKTPAASNDLNQVTQQAIASLGVAHTHLEQSALLQAPAATEAIPLQKPLAPLSNSDARKGMRCAHRVKAVRTLTGHSTDAVIAQLQAHYGTNHPKHLSSNQCDLLIEALVSDWYSRAHLPEPFPIIPYREHLQELRQQGLSEADALLAWMSQLENRNVHPQV